MTCELILVHVAEADKLGNSMFGIQLRLQT
jgi:hypothetical protein